MNSLWRFWFVRSHHFLGGASLPAGCPSPHQIKSVMVFLFSCICFVTIVLLWSSFPLPALYTVQILWSNSVEVVSLRMGAGRTQLPRCWWLSCSVRLSRLVQVGR